MEKESPKTSNQLLLRITIEAGVLVLAGLVFLYGITGDVSMTLFGVITFILLYLLSVKRIANYVVEYPQTRVAQMEDLLKDQDETAKLLVRRDLELTKANERLKKLDDMKSSFISVAAHQLRTPLSGVRWTLKMLLNGDLGPIQDEQKSFITKTYETNNRMIGLVNDMLSVDRIESGKMKYQPEPINLLELLKSILFEAMPNAEKRNVKVSIEPMSLVPSIVADPDQMRAAFQNIIENAVKYTPDGGTVTISIVRTNNHVDVKVADTGIGVPKDQQKELFRRFFRARNAIEVEADGSGLGLYLVKKIVERAGGGVSMRSKEGEGSVFTISLPLKR